MPGNSDSRFRSFAERYVIERARNWPADGTERDRAWQAMLDAKSIYAQIAQVDKAADLDGMGQAGQSAGPLAPYPTAPSPVSGPGKMRWQGVPMENVGEGDWLHQGKDMMAMAITACIKSGVTPPQPLRDAYRTVVTLAQAAQAQAPPVLPPVKERNSPSKRWWQI